jgi:hypothetical protein
VSSEDPEATANYITEADTGKVATVIENAALNLWVP